MALIKNLVDQRFGRLLVQRYIAKSYWECLCDCGNRVIVKTNHLKDGHSRSCGCLFIETTIQKGYNNRKYEEGDCFSSLYGSWNGMIQRCYGKNQDSKDYGYRGIIVCDEWKNDFLTFKKWSLKNGYNEGLSIDRIDVNGNYEPSNCRWADDIAQANNKRNNRRITIFSETKTLQEWSRISGLNYETIRYRVENNWPDDKILGIPYGYLPYFNK